MSNGSRSINKKPSINNKLKLWLRKKFNRDVGEDIQNIIESREKASDSLSNQEKELLIATLRFSSLEADSVSIPRNEIDYVDINASFAELLQEFNQCGHSRLLVCRKDLDEVLGFVTIKDLVSFVGKEEQFSLRQVMHPTTFVPEILPIPAVLASMQKNRVHIAVVVDEYGGTSGFITLMDILECLVGEADDEHDETSPIAVLHLRDGRCQIDARVAVEALEDKVKTLLGLTKISTEEFDTVGGFVLHLIGRVPQSGEDIKLPSGNIMHIDKADERRVIQVTVRTK